MAKSVTTIAFDADDTLWHNEAVFRMTQARFAALLSDFADAETLDARLLAAERRNLGHYGFGVKGFVLSMIETAIEVTDARVHASVIAELIAAGQDMLRHPIELLPHVERAVAAASESFRVILITKGDLLDQERKLAQSGLGDMFDAVEIVSEKTERVYTDIFASHGDGAARGAMVGNSMRSDVLPMIAAGGLGIFVPHDLAWDIEAAAAPISNARFHEIADLGGLPQLLSKLREAG
ncbi:MAG: HAD family hydrolase [Pseudomonadota bacterium]